MERERERRRKKCNINGMGTRDSHGFLVGAHVNMSSTLKTHPWISNAKSCVFGIQSITARVHIIIYVFSRKGDNEYFIALLLCWRYWMIYNFRCAHTRIHCHYVRRAHCTLNITCTVWITLTHDTHTDTFAYYAIYIPIVVAPHTHIIHIYYNITIL